MSMTRDPDLEGLLVRLARQPIQVIIETGTYNGLGSTKFIAEAFSHCSTLSKFYTCEVNYNIFNEAVKNLQPFSFIHCKYGSSVDLKEALDFVQNDTAIIDHQQFPDIFIDSVDDPVAFYSKELKGHLLNSSSGIWSWFKKITRAKESNLLKNLITENIDRNLFLVLDSAGGIGFLEFRIVLEQLAEKSYWVLMDDIHHLKHFRSYQYIQDHKDFEVLGSSPAHGWALAKHNP